MDQQCPLRLVVPLDGRPLGKEQLRRLLGLREGHREKETRRETAARKIAQEIKDKTSLDFVTQALVVASPEVYFFLDVYFPTCRCAAEIDGRSHDTKVAREYDPWRSRVLARKRVRVIRFRNEDLDDRPAHVLRELVRFLATTATPRGRRFFRKRLPAEWAAFLG